MQIGHEKMLNPTAIEFIFAFFLTIFFSNNSNPRP